MSIKFITLCLLLCGLAAPVWAGSDTAAQLKQVKLERHKVMQLRSQLEAQLGVLGQELRTFDVALVEARAAARKVSKKLAEINKKLKDLNRRKQSLSRRIQQLRQHMQQESVAAYQRAKREPGWMDVMAGVSVTEVPHRKYMMQVLLQQQEKDRQEWQALVIELAEVESQEKTRRDELVLLHAKKKLVEKEARAKVAAKRNMVRKVRRDKDLQKQRMKQLAAQEKGLLRLLNGLEDDLLAEDKMVKRKSIRKQRGKLFWPIRGKLTARFGSRSAKGRSKLAGVQMKPRSFSAKGRQVKAVAAGQVRYADWFGGYGLMMVVDHGDGLMTVYAHNDALYWQLGDWVEAGEVLADVGNTGWIENVRLYFEVRDKGKAVNPKRWCRR